MGVYNSDTTLGDLNRLDRDNYNHIDNKLAKTYRFPNAHAAFAFVGECLQTALGKCGVPVVPMDGDIVSRVMKDLNIKVEHRNYPPEEELYMSGWFVYDNREIAAFISNPFQRISQMIDTNNDVFVRTTVKGVF